MTVAPKGQDIEISLFQAGSYPDPNGGEIPGRRAREARLSRPPDCKKDFEELKSRGVKFEESKPGEYPWGIHATFIDPDENRFILLLPAAKQVW